ncbi:MAG: thioredoxin family protein [Nanopusillaceae archaeon]
MAILSESDRNTLKKIFEENLKEKVNIEVYLDFENNREASEIAKELFSELKELSDKINIEFIDLNVNNGKEKFEKNNLILDKDEASKGPIILFRDYPNIIFYGLPAGEEFPVFLEDLIHISNKEAHLPEDVKNIIEKIDKKIDIYVFVTPTCPYCPIASHSAHMFAMINKNIRGIVIEATEFLQLSEKFNILAVPTIVILSDGKVLDSWEGAISEREFAKKILKAIEKI